MTPPLAFASCVLLALSGLAGAADRHTLTIAATCMSCHGPDGRSLGEIPRLDGLSRTEFVTALRDFRSGARRATIMQRQASGYTDAEIDALGDYFATLK